MHISAMSRSELLLMTRALISSCVILWRWPLFLLLAKNLMVDWRVPAVQMWALELSVETAGNS